MFTSAEIDAQAIADWRPFFGMAAGTAAGLAGLVFVALSMHLKGIRAHPPYRYRAQSSLASMMLIFVVSGLVLFPKQTGSWLGAEELVAIAGDSAFIIWSFAKARAAVAKMPMGLTSLRPYQMRTTLAVLLSVIGMAGAALVWSGLEAGLYVLAAFSIVVMVWVVINSWALVVGITDEDEEKGSGNDDKTKEPGAAPGE
jgi:hypothetical protein